MSFRKGISKKNQAAKDNCVSFEDWNFEPFGQNVHKFFQAKKLNFLQHINCKTLRKLKNKEIQQLYRIILKTGPQQRVVFCSDKGKKGGRSSQQSWSLEKGFFKNFAKFTGTHLCQSLFLNKVGSLSPATLFKKRLWHSCFPLNFAKFLKKLFFIKHLWWLLLNFSQYYIF